CGIGQRDVTAAGVGRVKAADGVVVGTEGGAADGTRLQQARSTEEAGGERLGDRAGGADMDVAAGGAADNGIDGHVLQGASVAQRDETCAVDGDDLIDGLVATRGGQRNGPTIGGDAGAGGGDD